MNNRFHKNKIYRVIELTDRNGNIKYVVQAATSVLAAFFGIWVTYKLENDTLSDAIEHIQYIDGNKLVKDRVVHKVTLK